MRGNAKGMSAEPLVRAAGGVLVKGDDQGRPLVAVIHRPKYEDWSWPKGKLEGGERWKDAAVREVEEETGYRSRPLRELSGARYNDRKGRPKRVRYWLMEPLDGEFEPGREVDELRWVDRSEAARLLTYPHDRELLDEALGKAGPLARLRRTFRRG
jgi:8-oxo-dGTP pyrophosphatase MutT (NUDIX family)